MQTAVTIAWLSLALQAQNFTDVKPSPQQVAWQDLEIGVLLHHGPNSFMDREWGDGAADPKVFNPPQLDAAQWVAAAARGTFTIGTVTFPRCLNSSPTPCGSAAPAF